MFFGACLFAAVAAVAAPQGVSPQNPDLQADAAPSSVFADVRFVFCSDGLFYTELSETYQGLFEEVWADEKLSVDNHGFMENDLAPTIQEKVLARVPEKLHDAYGLFFPQSLTTASAELTGVALRPTADGGFAGFLGIVGRAGDCPALCTPPTRVYALSSKGQAPEITPRARPRLTDQGRAALSALLPEGHVEILCSRAFFCSRPDAVGALLIVRDKANGWTYLLPFVKREAGWVSIPIQTTHAEELPKNRKDNPGTSSSSFGAYPFPATEINAHGFVLENPGAGHGYILRDGEVFVLPDLDGSGGDEVLFISNAVSVLFSVVPQAPAADTTPEPGYRLQELHGVSFDN